MNQLNLARLGLAASLVGYVEVIGLGRTGVLGSTVGFIVALALIAAMALVAAACLSLQAIAISRRRKP